ncbi:hypothetical protein ASF00_16415 [Sphingomonas sp. Leaf34]|nr:hypothetical protein ASF00_16415 [Sphingomonas sp. Leaf34]KQN27901.1 hypothetical protein ASE88_16470 [Sphingomonas sp. Leaf38]
MTKTIFESDVPTSTSVDAPQHAPQPVQSRLRVNNFDGLRLIFAAMVVVFHVALLSQAPQLDWLYRYVSSGFAVQAFFVVSGFLVTMSFDNTTSLVSYAKKRIFRIAPAYIVVILVAAFALVAISTLSPGQYFADPRWRSYVASNLMLSNFRQPTLPGVFTNNFEPAVNGSLWTIKLEVMFYCLVPFIVWASRRFGYKPVVAALFVFSILWHGAFAYYADAHNSDLAARFAKQLPGQLAFFAGGTFAYYRTRDGLPPPAAWMVVCAVAGYALTQGMVFLVLAPICVTLIVYWASIRVPQLWSAKRSGDLSYGLYLYHFPIVQVLIALGAFKAAPIASLFAVCGLAFAAALVSWHVIEKNALRFAHSRTTAPRV